MGGEEIKEARRVADAEDMTEARKVVVNLEGKTAEVMVVIQGEETVVEVMAWGEMGMGVMEEARQEVMWVASMGAEMEVEVKAVGWVVDVGEEATEVVMAEATAAAATGVEAMVGVQRVALMGAVVLAEGTEEVKVGGAMEHPP